METSSLDDNAGRDGEAHICRLDGVGWDIVCPTFKIENANGERATERFNIETGNALAPQII